MSFREQALPIGQSKFRPAVETPSYDLSQPPEGKPVNEQEVRTFLEELKAFRQYSRKATSTLVVGGQVAAK